MEAKIIKRKRRVYQKKKGKYFFKQGKKNKLKKDQEVPAQQIRIKRRAKQPRVGTRDFNQIQKDSFAEQLQKQFIANYQREQFNAQINQRILQNESILDLINKKIEKHKDNPAKQKFYQEAKERKIKRVQSMKELQSKPQITEEEKKYIMEPSDFELSQSIVGSPKRKEEDLTMLDKPRKIKKMKLEDDEELSPYNVGSTNQYLEKQQKIKEFRNTLKKSTDQQSKDLSKMLQAVISLSVNKKENQEKIDAAYQQIQEQKGKGGLYEIFSEEGVALKDAEKIIQAHILPFTKNTDFYSIDDYAQELDLNYNKDLILLFLINQHYTVLYLRHSDLSINYFDSLGTTIPERKRHDLLFLQPHLKLYNEEYKFKTKFNTINYQKDPQFQSLCFYFVFEFLHRMIVLGESYKEASDYNQIEIEELFHDL